MNQNQNENPVAAEIQDDLYEQMVSEHLKSQNEIEYDLADTLDIKTSIALVVIIFLATQSGEFLAKPMPLHWHNIQVASVLCLVVAGLLAVWELIPRTYKVGLSPAEFSDWINKVKGFYHAQGVPNPEDKSIKFIRRKSIEQMETRFSENSAINKKKSRSVELTFYLTMASLILNLLTLAGLTSGWRY